MKFFKPEEFLNSSAFDGIFLNENIKLKLNQAIIICNLANDKLQREGKVVWSQYTKHTYGPYHCAEINEATHKAILINVEPLIICEHPSEKVRPNIQNLANVYNGYTCECGARVKLKINAFEVIE